MKSVWKNLKNFIYDFQPFSRWMTAKISKQIWRLPKCFPTLMSSPFSRNIPYLDGRKIYERMLVGRVFRGVEGGYIFMKVKTQNHDLLRQCVTLYKVICEIGKGLWFYAYTKKFRRLGYRALPSKKHCRWYWFLFSSMDGAKIEHVI